jgi:restriction system protein
MFVALPNGVYGLSLPEDSTHPISDQALAFEQIRRLHERHVQQVTEEIVAQLRSLRPPQFETLAKHLLMAYGFQDVEVTRVSRDGGIDGYGRLPVGMAHLNAAFQCKQWKANVGRPDVDRFRGAIQGRFEQGVMCATSTFSPEAQRASFVPGAVPIVLLDGDEIAKIILHKRLGVTTEYLPLNVFSIDVLLDEGPH